MTHHSGTSTGVLGAMLLRLWRRPCYFPKICSSCGILGRMRSFSIVKDIWAWYDVNIFFFNYYIYTLFICYGINPFLLGCPSHFQAWGDNQFMLPATGRRKKKTDSSCANTYHRWTQQCWIEEKIGRWGACPPECWLGPRRRAMASQGLEEAPAWDH